jgi:hypothetical protein
MTSAGGDGDSSGALTPRDPTGAVADLARVYRCATTRTAFAA